MPKMKTKSSAKKRFSKTGSGKIKRNFAYKRQLLGGKANKNEASVSRHFNVGSAGRKNRPAVYALPLILL